MTERIADFMPNSDDPEGTTRRPGRWPGQVTNNNDPDKRGRVEVSVPQVSGPNAQPIWARPAGELLNPGEGYGSLHLPATGDWVWVIFQQGHQNYPTWEAGWWGEDELPDLLKTNYPERRGTVTKDGHAILVDDKDHLILIQQKDGRLIQLDSNGVTIDAGNAQTTVKSGTKVVVDAPLIELVSGATHPVLIADSFLPELSQFLNTLLNVLSQGTKGGPTAQLLVGLQVVQAQLQQFITKCSGQSYLSEKVTSG
jgi:hypothetical protein